VAPQKSPKASSATTIILVRHGTTTTTGKELPGRAPGLHLAPKGIEQAQRVADALKSYSPAPTALYASPLERTKETAAPIAKGLGLRIKTHRSLLELDMGEWTGMALKDAARLPQWRTVQQHPSGFRFPGGESFNELATRITDGLSTIVAHHPGESVVCVSHADTIRAAISVAAGIPLDLFQRIHAAPCSVSVIRYDKASVNVISVNQSMEGIGVS